jgi:hypothetical protein
VQFLIDELEIDWELRGEAGNECKERLTVGFPGCVEANHSSAALQARKI